MKKTFMIITLALFSVTLFSQGFSTFLVDNALFAEKIKFAKGDAPSTVEVLVAPDTDLSNVKFKYKLISANKINPEISPDFTKPQQLKLVKSDGTSKDWIISVKRLSPAALPLNLSFSNVNPSNDWDNEVVGWAGLDMDQNNPTVARFGNQAASFWIAFNETPATLAYNLKIVSREPVKMDGEFIVEVSSDAKKWKIIAEYDSRNSISADGKYEHPLSKDVRFVRWTYVTRYKQNINLNHIVVSPK
jgi:hypothetical protein